MLLVVWGTVASGGEGCGFGQGSSLEGILAGGLDKMSFKGIFSANSDLKRWKNVQRLALVRHLGLPLTSKHWILAHVFVCHFGEWSAVREGKVNIFIAFGQNTTENEWRGVWRRFVSSCFSIFRARCCAKFEKKTFLFADEVGGIVFDIGAHSVRAGYAGEDCPKVNNFWRHFSANSV